MTLEHTELTAVNLQRRVCRKAHRPHTRRSDTDEGNAPARLSPRHLPGVKLLLAGSAGCQPPTSTRPTGSLRPQAHPPAPPHGAPPAFAAASPRQAGAGRGGGAGGAKAPRDGRGIAPPWAAAVCDAGSSVRTCRRCREPGDSSRCSSSSTAALPSRYRGSHSAILAAGSADRRPRPFDSSPEARPRTTSGNS